MDRLFFGTSHPSTSPTTDTSGYDMCVIGQNRAICKYIVKIIFTIPYSFTDDSAVHEENFITIILITFRSILGEYIPDPTNIDVTVTLTDSSNAAASNGNIEISSNVGIVSDEVYIAIDRAYNSDIIQNHFLSALISNVDDQYSFSGFSIDTQDIPDSEFLIVSGTPPTTTMSTIEPEEEERELWAFIDFDFKNYALRDWIIFGGCILLILIFCAFCCWCMNILRYKNIPDSTINTKTGRTRVSLFEIVADRQSQDRQKTLGFDPYKQATLALENQRSKSNLKDGTSPETEMQPVQVYKSNYAATPMKDQWNKALTAAADTNAFQKNISATEEEPQTGTHQSQVSWGGQSFGNNAGAIHDTHFFKVNPSDRQSQLGSLNEEEEQDTYQYSDNVNTTSFANIGASSSSASGAAPPPVTGSMVDRMNSSALNHAHAPDLAASPPAPGPAVPPPVRGSMLDRMNNTGDGVLASQTRLRQSQNYNNKWYQD